MSRRNPETLEAMRLYLAALVTLEEGNIYHLRAKVRRLDDGLLRYATNAMATRCIGHLIRDGEIMEIPGTREFGMAPYFITCGLDPAFDPDHDDYAEAVPD